MIAHTHLHVSDYAKSKSFYTTVLAALGYENNMEIGEAAGFFDGKNTGYRESYWPGYYAAFVIDPDGHNIEAVWYDYEKE